MFYIQNMQLKSYINVLALEVCMVSINLEKLAERQNSECCNADF